MSPVAGALVSVNARVTLVDGATDADSKYWTGLSQESGGPIQEPRTDAGDWSASSPREWTDAARVGGTMLLSYAARGESYRSVSDSCVAPRNEGGASREALDRERAYRSVKRPVDRDTSSCGKCRSVSSGLARGSETQRGSNVCGAVVTPDRPSGTLRTQRVDRYRFTALVNRSAP